MLTKIQTIVLTSLLNDRLAEGAMSLIIEATGNVDVALEMLANVYTRPDIAVTSPKNYYSEKSRTNIHFITTVLLVSYFIVVTGEKIVNSITKFFKKHW